VTEPNGSKRKTPPKQKALGVIARHRTLLKQVIDNPEAARNLDEGLLKNIQAEVIDSISPPSPEPPEISRVGLGYRAVFPMSGIEMGLERIREGRGEVHGELYVSVPVSDNTFPDGHIFGARFNVSSLAARTSVGKYLSSRLKDVDWDGMLERFCMEILAAERKGEDFQSVGADPQEPPDRWLLRPILLKGKTTILFGPGGSWKSTIGAAVAVSVATGAEVVPGWRTHEAGLPDRPAPVLILDWEDGNATWNRRLNWIAVGAKQLPPEVHYRHMSRPLVDDLESIAKYVSDNKIELLIVDSVGLAAGAQSASESPADGAFRLFTALRQLGTTNMLIDHVAGAELGIRGPSNKPYGSVYKINLARSVFEVRSEKASGNRCEVLLLHTKTNSARVPPQQLLIVYGEVTIEFMQWAVTSPELKRALPKPRKDSHAERSTT